MKSKYDIDFGPNGKLPLQDKIIWASVAGCTLLLPAYCAGYYLMYFCTDVLGISAAVAGTVFLIARSLDVVTDAIEAYLVDKLCMKWGKFRSWSIIFAVPFTLCMILLFTNFNFSSMGVRVAYISILYCLLGAVFCTGVFIPTNAQITYMTGNLNERVTATSIKAVFNSIIQIIVTAVYWPLIQYFAGKDGNMSRGFFWASVFIAAIMFASIIANIIVQKKYELNEDGSPRAHLLAISQNQEPFFQQLKGLLTNRPAMVLMGGVVFLQSMMGCKTGCVIYLFNSYLNDPSNYSVAMLAMTLGMTAGVVLVKPMNKLFGDTNRSYLANIALNVIVNVALQFLILSMPVEKAAQSFHFGLLFWLNTLSGFLLGACLVYAATLLPNCVDYGEWKTGRAQPGFVFGLYGLLITAGGAIGGALLGYGLAAYGYEAGAVLAQSTLNGLVSMTYLIPAVVMVLMFIVQMFWNMPDKLYVQISEELKIKHEKQNAEMEAKLHSEKAE